MVRKEVLWVKTKFNLSLEVDRKRLAAVGSLLFVVDGVTHQDVFNKLIINSQSKDWSGSHVGPPASRLARINQGFGVFRSIRES